MKDSTIITRKIKVRAENKGHYSILREWNKYVYKAFNIGTTTLFGIKNIRDEYLSDEAENKLSSKEDGILKEKTLQNVPYDIISRRFGAKSEDPKLPAPIYGAISLKVFQKYKNIVGDVFSGKVTVPNYKFGCAIPFVKKAIRNLDEEGFDFIQGTQFKFVYGRDRSNNRETIKRVANEEYQLCDSSFMFSGKDLFFFFTMKIPVQKHKLNKKKIVGVDLGVNVPAYVALNDSKDRQVIGSRDGFLNQRNGFIHGRKRLSMSMRDSKGGKGQRRKMKAMDRFKNKEKNWAKEQNNIFSKRIIDFALKHGAGKINIEDLKGINTSNYLLARWGYFQLQTMIEQKAKKHGIEVNKVDPAYTSKTCSECGSVHENNRDGVKFKCVDCEHEVHADYNAAKNISRL